MAFKKEPLRFQQILFALIVMGWGFAVLLLYGSLLIQFIDWTDFQNWSRYLPCTAFYLKIPYPARYQLLWIRFSIAVLQIFAAAWLLFHELKALFVLRVLAMAGVLTVVLNPYYSDAEVSLYIIPYLMALMFTHHEQNVLPCVGQAMARRDESARRILESLDEDKGRRFSKGIILLGTLEIVIGALLIREGLWNVPIEGWPVFLRSRFGMELVLHVSRAVFMEAGVLLSAAGVLLLGHRQTGRMLNMIMAVSGFIVSCGLVFVIQPPAGQEQKILFLIFMSVLLIVFAMIYFLLTNPTVMRQFHHRRNLSGAMRTARTVGFVVLLGALLSVVHLLFYTFAYETAPWTAPRYGYRVHHSVNLVDQTRQTLARLRADVLNKTRRFIRRLQPETPLPHVNE